MEHVVAGKTRIVDVTPTLDTSAYTAGDVLFATTEIPNVERGESTPQGQTLVAVTLVDKDDEGAAITLYFFGSNVALGTINNAPNIADADAAACLGVVDIATGDYDDLGGVKVAHVRGINLPMCPASGTSLYVAATCVATPTYTAASDLVLRLHFDLN